MRINWESELEKIKESVAELAASMDQQRSISYMPDHMRMKNPEHYLGRLEMQIRDIEIRLPSRHRPKKQTRRRA